MALCPRIFTRTAILPLITVLLACASCRPDITEIGKRQLRSAADLVNEGAYDAAAEKLDKVIKAYPASGEVGEAQYMIGLCRVHTGQTDLAQLAFSDALDVADVPILEYYIRLSLANLAFESRKYSVAREFYGPYIDNLPRREPFQLAYYRYGLMLQANGQWKQADVQFARIMQIFPETDILPSVRTHFGHTHYAIELGRFLSAELAASQRREFTDLSPKPYWKTKHTPDGWQYVNLYGEFPDRQQAEHALGQIKPRLAQARIVP